MSVLRGEPHIEYGARQERFRTSLPDSGVTVSYVSGPDGLETVLYQALVPISIGLGRVLWIMGRGRGARS